MTGEGPLGRIDALDALRGLALFGIMVSHLQYVFDPIVLGPFPDPPGSFWGDTIAYWVMALLAGGTTFLAVFAALFGCGLALMLDHEGVGRGRVTRRLMILLVLGGMHGVLLWTGDILAALALMGLVVVWGLLLVPLRWLWPLALGLIGFELALEWYWAFAFSYDAASVLAWWSYTYDAGRDVSGMPFAPEMGASYLENVGHRLELMAHYYRYGHYWLPGIAGHMLIGVWLVRSGVVTCPGAHAVRLLRWRWYALAGAVVLLVLATLALHGERAWVARPPLAIGLTLEALGKVCLVLGVVGLFFRFSARLLWLAPVGRMSLSLYLLQSCVWVAFIHGVGVGWNSGFLSPALQAILGIWLFAVQIALARWWLARFRLGPFEWAWRCLIAGRVLALRKSGAGDAARKVVARNAG